MIAVCVGLYITAACWFTASRSFANPAGTIAGSLSAPVAWAVMGWLLKEEKPA